MKTTQLFYHPQIADAANNGEILKVLRKRLKAGWYTVGWRGVTLDKSTICLAERNRGGELKYK